jgi:tetratricopeptide (TPR) repeat protein
MVIARARLFAFLPLLAVTGCPQPSPRYIAVPPEMLRSSTTGGGRATGTTPTGSSAVPPSQYAKYVVRLAEGGRVWEMELPEATGGYEMRVPVVGGPAEMITAADEELFADSTMLRPSEKPAEAGKDLKEKDKKVDARAAAKKKSYLGAMAKVNEMYSSRRYELALIEVVNLEKEYPNDSRLLAMKGSLYLKLGRIKLAREAWEKALAQNPNDQGVAEALRDLSSREE